MMRKFFISTLFTVIATISVTTYGADRDSGITIGLGFGISNDKIYEGKNVTTNIIAPRLSYRFNNNIEIGAMMKFRYRASDYPNYKLFYTYGGFVSYSYLKFNHVNLFVDLIASHNYEHDPFIDPGAITHSRKYSDVGFTPGISYNIPGSNLNFNLRYMFIGFNDAGLWYKQRDTCLGRGKLIFDAGLRQIEIGASYKF